MFKSSFEKKSNVSKIIQANKDQFVFEAHADNSMIAYQHKQNERNNAIVFLKKEHFIVLYNAYKKGGNTNFGKWISDPNSGIHDNQDLIEIEEKETILQSLHELVDFSDNKNKVIQVFNTLFQQSNDAEDFAQQVMDNLVQSSNGLTESQAIIDTDSDKLSKNSHYQLLPRPSNENQDRKKKNYMLSSTGSSMFGCIGPKTKSAAGAVVVASASGYTAATVKTSVAASSVKFASLSTLLGFAGTCAGGLTMGAGAAFGLAIAAACYKKYHLAAGLGGVGIGLTGATVLAMTNIWNPIGWALIGIGGIVALVTMIKKSCSRDQHSKNSNADDELNQPMKIGCEEEQQLSRQCIHTKMDEQQLTENAEAASTPSLSI